MSDSASTSAKSHRHPASRGSGASRARPDLSPTPDPTFDVEDDADPRLPSSSNSRDFRSPSNKNKGRQKIDKLPGHDSTIFGHLHRVPHFTIFKGFDEMYASGVHCATQRGIAGSHTGCRSVVLNSGYTGDREAPNEIIMDGEGGRKKNSKVHERDQDWGSTGNKALLESWHSGQPVRVCRGSLTRYGPEEGYRYDGEWTVIDAWQVKAPDGYLRCQFHLVRLPDQPLDPEHGMPALSSRLLQAIDNVNRFRPPNVYRRQEDTPRLIAQMNAIIEGGEGPGPRKRQRREWDDLPSAEDEWAAGSSRAAASTRAPKRKKTHATVVISRAGSRATSAPTPSGSRAPLRRAKQRLSLDMEETTPAAFAPRCHARQGSSPFGPPTLPSSPVLSTPPPPSATSEPHRYSPSAPDPRDKGKQREIKQEDDTNVPFRFFDLPVLPRRQPLPNFKRFSKALPPPPPLDDAPTHTPDLRYSVQLPPAPSLPPIGLAPSPSTTTAVSQLPHLDGANEPAYYDDVDDELTLGYPDE
ncbi:hypothetical protein EV714DRAFT_220162 [Schizophyllum commune]